MKFYKRFIIFFILLFIFSSCSNKEVSHVSQTQIKKNDIVYFKSNDLGGIKGSLVTDDPNERIGLILYLGEIITDSNGMYGGILDTSKAPKAMIDEENGNFSFTDIQPGQYSLIIYEVVFGGKAYTDETGNVKVIIVNEGEVTDLGEINFDGF